MLPGNSGEGPSLERPPPPPAPPPPLPGRILQAPWPLAGTRRAPTLSPVLPGRGMRRALRPVPASLPRPLLLASDSPIDVYVEMSTQCVPVTPRAPIPSCHPLPPHSSGSSDRTPGRAGGPPSRVHPPDHAGPSVFTGTTFASGPEQMPCPSPAHAAAPRSSLREPSLDTGHEAACSCSRRAWPSASLEPLPARSPRRLCPAQLLLASGLGGVARLPERPPQVSKAYLLSLDLSPVPRPGGPRPQTLLSRGLLSIPPGPPGHPSCWLFYSPRPCPHCRPSFSTESLHGPCSQLVPPRPDLARDVMQWPPGPHRGLPSRAPAPAWHRGQASLSSARILPGWGSFLLFSGQHLPASVVSALGTPQPASTPWGSTTPGTCPPPQPGGQSLRSRWGTGSRGGSLLPLPAPGAPSVPGFGAASLGVTLSSLRLLSFKDTCPWIRYQGRSHLMILNLITSTKTLSKEGHSDGL